MDRLSREAKSCLPCKNWQKLYQVHLVSLKNKNIYTKIEVKFIFNLLFWVLIYSRSSIIKTVISWKQPAPIALDKMFFFSIQKHWSFSYFSMKTYVVGYSLGAPQRGASEVLLMSTHNICFHGEIRKVIFWLHVLLLSGDMIPCETVLLIWSFCVCHKRFL